MSDWEDISSAPHGVDVLLWCDGVICTGRFDREPNFTRLAWISNAPTAYGADDETLLPQPSKWQPLPSGPDGGRE